MLLGASIWCEKDLVFGITLSGCNISCVIMLSEPIVLSTGGSLISVSLSGVIGIEVKALSYVKAESLKFSVGWLSIICWRLGDMTDLLTLLLLVLDLRDFFESTVTHFESE